MIHEFFFTQNVLRKVCLTLILIHFLALSGSSQKYKELLHCQILDIDKLEVDNLTLNMQDANKSIENGEFEIAISKYLSILDRYELDTINQADIFGKLTRLYKFTGDYESSILMHLNTINLISDSVKLMHELTSMSEVYISLGDYKTAEDILRHSIIFYESKKKPFNVFMSMGRVALLNITLKQYHKSIELGKKAIDYIWDSNLKTLINNKHSINFEIVYSAILNNIADSYIQIGELDSAYTYLEKAKENFDFIPDHSKVGIYISYGEYYTKTGQYNLAIKNFQKGISMAENFKLQHPQKVGYKELSKLYELKSNPDLALEYLKKYVAINDEITSTENIHKINHLQNKYVLEKKDRQITEHELQLFKKDSTLNTRKQQLVLIIIISSSIIVLSFLIYRNMSHKQKILRQRVRNIDNEKNILQIKAELEGEKKERTRLARELHDSVVSELFVMKLKLNNLCMENSDNLLYGPIKHAVDEMDIISENLRRTTHNMLPIGLKEVGLIEVLKTYISKLEHSAIKFYFQSYGKVFSMNEKKEKIVIMIINELIQNILKHSRATEAIVQLNYNEDSISITVEDNGSGISNARLQNTDGMGLKNVRKNVSLLDGTIDIETSETIGTTIFIEIAV